jgi:BON domain
MISDLELRQNLLDELEFEPSSNVRYIGVARNRGVVTLTGLVTSYAEKAAAEGAARRVKGAKAMAEEIEVSLASDPKCSMTRSRACSRYPEMAGPVARRAAYGQGRRECRRFLSLVATTYERSGRRDRRLGSIVRQTPTPPVSMESSSGPTISMISAAVAGRKIRLIKLFLRYCVNQDRTASVGGR